VDTEEEGREKKRERERERDGGRESERKREGGDGICCREEEERDRETKPCAVVSWSIATSESDTRQGKAV
jgi:hypothetical protein